MDFIERKYKQFIKKNGFFSKMFNPYNCKQINDIAPTLTTNCGSETSSSIVLIAEEVYNETKKIKYKKVNIDFTISLEMEVPEDWNDGTIEYHYNDGSWCANNLIDIFQKMNEEDKCICPITKAEVK